jgi:hypothetical protein
VKPLGATADNEETTESGSSSTTKPVASTTHSPASSEVNKDETGAQTSSSSSSTSEEEVSATTTEEAQTSTTVVDEEQAGEEEATTFPPPPLVQYLEPMADEECQDLNSEFCTYIGSRPEYCDKRYYLNNKTVLEICKRTCHACNTTFSSFGNKPTKKPVPLKPNGQECRDYNLEFCRYVSKKPSLCHDDTMIGDNQRISEICRFIFLI